MKHGTEQELQYLFDWIRTLPDRVQEVVERFPPYCQVRATVGLRCPAPGELAFVYGYQDRGQHGVLVLVEGENMRAECQSIWLDVVKHDLVTPEVVRMVCGKEEPLAKRRRKYVVPSMHLAWSALRLLFEEQIRDIKSDLRHGRLGKSGRRDAQRQLHRDRQAVKLLYRLRLEAKKIAYERRTGKTARLKVIR